MPEKRRIAASLHDFDADETELRQILFNLVLNARAQDARSRSREDFAAQLVAADQLLGWGFVTLHPARQISVASPLMRGLARVRWVHVVWLLAVGAAVPSCASNSDGGSGYCQTLEARQRECGALAATGSTSCVNYGDAPEHCEAECVKLASCEEINAWTCFGPVPELFTCMARCVGLAPVTCKDGSKLPGYTRCNGSSDCGTPNTDGTSDDSTDEDGCETTGYKCRDAEGHVPYSVYCDGKKDCADGSDENADCTVVGTCDDRDILTSMRCNGIAECSDGADEPSDCAVRTCE